MVLMQLWADYLDLLALSMVKKSSSDFFLFRLTFSGLFSICNAIQFSCEALSFASPPYGRQQPKARWDLTLLYYFFDHLVF